MAGEKPGERSRRTIIDSGAFGEIYRSWSEAIASAMSPRDAWAIIGIKRGGAILARRLKADLEAHPPAAGAAPRRRSAGDIAFGEVDISLYRDDYHLQAAQPRVLGTEISFDLEGRRIILVDDVLYTGRTVRAAIDQILDFGRPRKIVLAVLVDRGHRELPIAPDFTGRRIETAQEDRVEVSFRETDGEDRVELIGPR